MAKISRSTAVMLMLTKGLHVQFCVLDSTLSFNVSV